MAEMVGHRFGRLTVTARVENRGIQPYWAVVCDCGTRKEIAGGTLHEPEGERDPNWPFVVIGAAVALILGLGIFIA